MINKVILIGNLGGLAVRIPERPGGGAVRPSLAGCNGVRLHRLVRVADEKFPADPDGAVSGGPRHRRGHVTSRYSHACSMFRVLRSNICFRRKYIPKGPKSKQRKT